MNKREVILKIMFETFLLLFSGMLAVGHGCGCRTDFNYIECSCQLTYRGCSLFKLLVLNG
jgi:hypothetical protein